MDFSKKNVLVTGSSRGIGRAIAWEFAEKGANVMLNANKSIEELKKTCQEFQRAGFSCAYAQGDVSQYDDCKQLFSEIEGRFGPVDILVNNAGISCISLFTDMHPVDWHTVIQTNLYSVLNCTHLAIPAMVRKKEGCIINISSMWGERGASCEAVYSAAKGGVNAFTKAMAKELGPSQIRVNAIACGVIDTAMNQFLDEDEKKALKEEISLLRFGKVEETAHLACFLAGQDAAFLTGQILTLDGGML